MSITADQINKTPEGYSLVKNDKYGQPQLPSTHQIGDDVLVPARVIGVSFAEGETEYLLETTTHDEIALDASDVKKTIVVTMQAAVA